MSSFGFTIYVYNRKICGFFNVIQEYIFLKDGMMFDGIRSNNMLMLCNSILSGDKVRLKGFDKYKGGLDTVHDLTGTKIIHNYGIVLQQLQFYCSMLKFLAEGICHEKTFYPTCIKMCKYCFQIFHL